MRQLSGSGGSNKERRRRTSTNRIGSFATKALIASATVSTSYAAYSLLSSTVSAQKGAEAEAVSLVEKKDDTYSISYLGFDSYPGTEVDDGTGVATEEFRATSLSNVKRATSLSNVNIDGIGLDAHRIGLAVECQAYGCPLLPLDVHYEQEVKSKLEKLRKKEGTSEEKDDYKDYPLNSSGTEKAATLTLIGYKGGSLKSQVNQDRSLALIPYQYWNLNPDSNLIKVPSVARLIGAFDGHATFGEKVSEYVVKTLPSLLGSKLVEHDAKRNQNEGEADSSVVKLLSETFLELDATSPADPSGGCTASLVLQLGAKLYVANAGDSRSFIAVHIIPPEGSNPDKETTTSIIYASREDKPHLEDEKKRVEHMGGTVYLPNSFQLTGKGTTRVLYQDPTTGNTSGLAMSRSIGDWDAGSVGCVPDPIVDVLDMNEIKRGVLLSLNKSVEIDDGGESCVAYSEDNIKVFAVSATDGLLDFMNIETIAFHAAKGLYDGKNSHPLLACEDLIYAAANGWQKDKGGRYRDDIAIAIADLELE